MKEYQEAEDEEEADMRVSFLLNNQEDNRQRG